MRKIMLAAFAALALAGCEESKTPEAANFTKNGIEVQKLFENEGCTVYKFRDEGRYRYYATCPGRTTTNDVYNCGKNCIQPQTIDTIELEAKQ